MIVCLTCLWHTAQNTATGTSAWTGWTSLGGVSTNNPTVVRAADGRLEVYVIGTTKSFYRNAQTAPGSPTWSGWTSVGTEPFAGVRPEGKAVKAQGKARLDTR
jgi:hypothetical protein